MAVCKNSCSFPILTCQVIAEADCHIIHENKVSEPTRTLFLADSRSNWFYSDLRVRVPNTTVFTSRPFLLAHQNRSNAAFFDGHCENLSKDKIKKSFLPISHSPIDRESIPKEKKIRSPYRDLSEK